MADLHVDLDHHRSVLTMLGDPGSLVDALDRLAGVAIASIDLGSHAGVHPRLGALDVVPFCPVAGSSLEAAKAARDVVAARLAARGLPVFFFGLLGDGSDRALPHVRKHAFDDLAPDLGPSAPHATAGAVCVGARGPLVAWNVWLQGASIAETRQVARAIRGPALRTMGFQLRGATQVSCNLVAPSEVTPLDAFEMVEARLRGDAHVVRCELVGLAPRSVLEQVPESRWQLLDLDLEHTVEAAAARLGIAVS